MRAYVLIQVQPGEASALARDIRAAPGVTRATPVCGTVDVIAEVEGKDLASLGKVVFEAIRVQPGVINTQTCLAVE
jgi:DNA-binding Lrp family transcriptional regulator